MKYLFILIFLLMSCGKDKEGDATLDTGDVGDTCKNFYSSWTQDDFTLNLSNITFNVTAETDQLYRGQSCVVDYTFTGDTEEGGFTVDLSYGGQAAECSDLDQTEYTYVKGCNTIVICLVNGACDDYL